MSEHPTIYDISTDEHRPITQEDVDSLLSIKAAFVSLYESLPSLRQYLLLVAQGKAQPIPIPSLLAENVPAMRSGGTPDGESPRKESKHA